MKNPFFKTGLMALVLVAFSVTTFSEVSGYGGGGTRTRLPKAPAGEVLGETTIASTTVAAKFQFENNLSIGSTHSDVIELQKVLIAGGYLVIPAPTGYFGPMTFAAVKAYQAAHPEIGFVTGYFGPLTRAVMNK